MKKAQQSRRESYEPPQVKRVRIVPEELAVAGCKQKTATMGPTVGCFRSNCKNVSS